MEFKSYIGYDFGRPDVLSGGRQVQADDSPPIAKIYWSGRVFVGGKLTLNQPDWRKTTELPAYVKVTVNNSGAGASIVSGEMPTTFPVDAEFYDLENTFGDIHCDRF